MTQTDELRRALGEAIVVWAADRRGARGDLFATADELESIKSDPLEFSDLLKGEDAYEFLRQVLGVIQRRGDAALEAGQAAARRNELVSQVKTRLPDLLKRVR